MRTKTRLEIFETNSSSTHTLTVMMKDDYNRWSSHNNHLYYYNGSFDYGWVESDVKPINGSIYTREEVIDFIKKNKYYSDEEWNSYDEDERDNYFQQEYGFIGPDQESENETYYQEFTTRNGDQIVAFGEYGYDY